MYQKTVQLTTGFMAGLIVVSVMAAGAPSSGKKQSAAPRAADLVAPGHALFLSNCSACHGADAQGDDGPNLHHKSLPDTFIAGAVTNGFKNEMPPFGSKLKPAELKEIVAYVHSLQK